MRGAWLTLRQRKDSKSQNPSEQVRAKKADRMRIVRMAPEVEVIAAASPTAVVTAAGTAAAGDKK